MRFLLVSVVSLVSASAALSRSAPSTARIDVEFLPDGRCTVSAAGDTFHSKLTYTPPAAIVQAFELRCGIPPVPEGTAVELSVALPPGVSPSQGQDAPRLTWTQRDDRWFGTASLSMAPSVLRIQEGDSPRMRRARTIRWAVRVAGALALAGVVAGFRRWRR